MPIWTYSFARCFCTISVMQMARTVTNLSAPNLPLLFSPECYKIFPACGYIQR